MVETESKVALTLEKITEHLSERFINSAPIAEILYIGYNTPKNVILWGPGGHGKSEMTEEFFRCLGVTPFVQALGEGSTEDLLLGGVDIRQFNDTGKIFYNVESSFMNHEYVVFEELLDCPAQVLLRLKDILTSGWFRSGEQQFKIKTKWIVCLTNRSREEVSEDRSIEALMERFPMEYEVKWQTYSEINYEALYKKVFKLDDNSYLSDKFHLLTVATVASNTKTKKTISPRTAVYAAQAFIKNNNDLDTLKYFHGYVKEGIEEARQQEKILVKIEKERKVLQAKDKQLTDLLAGISKKFVTLTTAEQASYITQGEAMKEEIERCAVEDANSGIKATLLQKATEAITIMNKIHEQTTKA